MATASTTPVSPLLSTSARSLPPSPPKSSLSFKPSSKEPQQLAASSELQEAHWGCRRRDLLAAAAAMTPFLLAEPPRSGAREVEVGSYLPPDPSNPSFVVFKASPKDTPALRAGNVQPYEFILPPSWKQTRIANILSGNYCQPKCAEPWIEVKFEDDKQGKVQVVVSPLIRLTNKPNATIEEIGNPEKVIASLGPFVTGNTFDPDELLEASIKKQGDQTYYTYLLETPYALTGTHNLAKATAKGSTVVLFVVSANDKQWPACQETLRTILDSFQTFWGSGRSILKPHHFAAKYLCSVGPQVSTKDTELQSDIETRHKNCIPATEDKSGCPYPLTGTARMLALAFSSRWGTELLKGRTQEYVTYLTLSKSTTTKIFDTDLGAIIPSLSPSPASRGSTSTETTTEEEDFLPGSFVVSGGFLKLSSVSLTVAPGSGMARGCRALLFFTLPG